VLLFGYAGVIIAKNSTEKAKDENPEAVESAKKLTDNELEDDIARSASQIFTNEKGELDLLDTQYALFTLFTVTFFLYQLVVVTQNSFPPLGAGLLTLIGASAMSYTVKKYLENKELARPTPNSKQQ
jgi:hypothetical protein